MVEREGNYNLKGKDLSLKGDLQEKGTLRCCGAVSKDVFSIMVQLGQTYNLLAQILMGEKLHITVMCSHFHQPCSESSGQQVFYGEAL